MSRKHHQAQDRANEYHCKNISRTMTTTNERRRRSCSAPGSALRRTRTDLLSPLEHSRLKRGSGGLTMALSQMSILVWILMGSILFDNLISSESSKSAHPIAQRSRKVPPFTLLPRAIAFNLWHNIEKLEQQATSKRSITTTTTPIIMPPQPTTRRNNEDEELSKSFDEASSSWPPQEMRNEDDEEDIMENSSSINHKKNEALVSQPSTESFLSFLSSLHKNGNDQSSDEQPKTMPTSTAGDDGLYNIVTANDKVTNQQEQEQTHRNQQEQDAEVSDITRDDEIDKEDNLVVASFVARKKICTKPLPLTFLNAQKVVESVDDPTTTLFLKDFFLKHRNLLFADGATIREINEPSDSLWKVFNEEQEQHKQRRRQNGSKEDQMLMDQEANHFTQVITKFLELSNPPMGFLGLQLISKVIVATQLFCFLEQKSSTNRRRLPEYQFTLVGSSFDARGPKPLVWVFNKIMKRGDDNNNGSANKNKKDVENATTFTRSNGKKKKAMKTSGFTRVWAEEVSSSTLSDGSTFDTENEMATGEGDDSTIRTAKMHSKNTSTSLPMSSHNKIDMIGTTEKKKNDNLNNEATSPNPNNMIRFCTDATLVSDLVFPKLLVRILPVSLEKMEEEGSKAMQGAVEKDIIPAMERIQKAWYNCTKEDQV